MPQQNSTYLSDPVFQERNAGPVVGGRRGRGVSIDPSLQQIRDRCLAVQAEWDERETAFRRIPHLELDDFTKAEVELHWHPPVVSLDP